MNGKRVREAKSRPLTSHTLRLKPPDIQVKTAGKIQKSDKNLYYVKIFFLAFQCL